VLIGAGAGALGVGGLGAGLTFFVADYVNQSREAPDIYTQEAGQIGHLLRRAGFGPSPYDIGDYISRGVNGSIDRLIDFSAVQDDLDARVDAVPLDFTKAPDIVRWALLRMLETRRPLEEKMTLFWHGVLTSSFGKIGGKQNFPLLIQQNKLLRAKSMGRFDDLIRAVTTDPAMLWWLDGRLSTGQSPNENYARELMELFTLGIGNYTQDDVHQGALALAGWKIQGGKGVLVSRYRYTGSATFLGHTGDLGVDDVVRIVCAHPATGKHIAWRMWSFFVYENPSDGDLQPLVDAYYQKDHSISAMVRAMLTSPAFFSDKAYRARVKSPVEYVIGALRGLGITSGTDGHELPPLLAALGQVPFDPPDVSGWPGDKASGAWVSTQTWMNRVNFINQLVAAAAPSGKRASGSALAQLIHYRQMRSAREVADYLIASLLDNRASDDRRAIVYDAIQTPQPGDTPLPLAHGATVGIAAVRNVLYLLMSSPEYQMS
jgi:uncharacterized protein (DUF1800 family)